MSSSGSDCELDLKNFSIGSDSEDAPEVAEPVIEQVKLVSLPCCPICNLPIDYCDFGTRFPQCAKHWLSENKDLFLKYHRLSDEDIEKYSTLEDSAEVKPNQSQKKKKVVEEEKVVTIKCSSRGKRKTITLISGLEKFGIKLDKASKTFAKKFACGSGVLKSPTGEVIEIQGEHEMTLPTFLLKEFPKELDASSIVILKD